MSAESSDGASEATSRSSPKEVRSYVPHCKWCYAIKGNKLENLKRSMAKWKQVTKDL